MRRALIYPAYRWARTAGPLLAFDPTHVATLFDTGFLALSLSLSLSLALSLSRTLETLFTSLLYVGATFSPPIPTNLSIF
jgi:hypothetical protein